MRFLDHRDVVAQRKALETAEVRLAQRMRTAYWHSDLGRLAQDQLRPLVDEMHFFRDRSFGRGSQALINAMNEEAGLRVWTRLPPERDDSSQLGSLLAKLDRHECDLHDCADILRLFGVYAENHPDRRAGVKRMRAEKQGDDPLKGAFSKMATVDPRKKRNPEPNDRTVSARSGAFRSRGESGAVLPEEVHEDPVPPMCPEFLSNVFTSGTSPTVKSGCNRWSLRMQSKVCQIDKAFGLPFGADISGTVADSMYGLGVAGCAEIAAGWAKVPNTYDRLNFDFLALLPLISLVELYNHTFLECALALVYCDLIDDYHIGYYTDLFPGQRVFRREYDPLRAALVQAERDAPKFMVYTREDLLHRGETNVLRGFLMETDAEKQQFKALASTKAFYAKALSYPECSGKFVMNYLGKDLLLSRQMLMSLARYDRTHVVNFAVACTESEYLRSCFTSSEWTVFSHSYSGRRLRAGYVEYEMPELPMGPARVVVSPEQRRLVR